MSKLFLTVITILLTTATQTTFAAKAAEQERTATFTDDFEGRTELGDYTTGGKTNPDTWRATDGFLRGNQTNPAHGATFRKLHIFDDFDAEFDFRFSGGKRFNFVIDDHREKSVHAGHICRVMIAPRKITVADDKTGSMNLEIRNRRKDTNPSADKKAALEKLLNEKKASGKVKLKNDQWYRLRVKIEGDLMEAYLDGKLVASLKSPGIAHPTKTKFGFTVTGTHIDFDNLTIYDVAK